jgi:ribosomal protein L11 methyltransferase
VTWQRVSLVVAGEHAEALAEALEAGGALTTEITDADAGTEREQAVFGEPGADAGTWPRCRVTALFAADADAGGAIHGALQDSAAITLAPASIDHLEDADWVAVTQRQFDPIQAGRRVWVVPSWHEPPDPAAINVMLDPGAAFGTGSHPTTRLCIAWLEEHVANGDFVLDYGCGSGILAIVAMKLGAGRANGVDVDPLALQAARYNAQRNGVAIEVLDGEAPLPARFDVTVANILANPLRMLAALICGHTRPGGGIALSGILAEQAGEVVEAYAPWADLGVEASEGDWVLVAGTRRQ